MKPYILFALISLALLCTFAVGLEAANAWIRQDRILASAGILICAILLTVGYALSAVLERHES